MVNTTLVKHHTCYTCTSTACATYGMNRVTTHSLFRFLHNFFYSVLVLFTDTHSKWACLQPPHVNLTCTFRKLCLFYTHLYVIFLHECLLLKNCAQHGIITHRKPSCSAAIPVSCTVQNLDKMHFYWLVNWYCRVG